MYLPLSLGYGLLIMCYELWFTGVIGHGFRVKDYELFMSYELWIMDYTTCYELWI